MDYSSPDDTENTGAAQPAEPHTNLGGTRPNRQPKPKCVQCRKDRQLCSPQAREWPTKCDRCLAKNMPCSEPQMAARQPRAETNQAAMPAPASPRGRPSGPGGETGPSARGRKRRREESHSRSQRSSPEGLVSPGGGLGGAEATTWGLADMTDAVCMFQLVSSEYRTLDNVATKLEDHGISPKCKRIDDLRDQLPVLQLYLREAVWERLTASDQDSAEHLLYFQLLQLISHPDAGRTWNFGIPAPPEPKAAGEEVECRAWLSTANGIFAAQPSIRNAVYATHVTFTQLTDDDFHSYYNNADRRRVRRWWSGAHAANCMRLTAEKVGLPRAFCRTSFWERTHFMLPTTRCDFSADVGTLANCWLGVASFLHGVDALCAGDFSFSGDDSDMWTHSSSLWEPHKVDPFGHTGLHLAVLANSEEVTRKILDKSMRAIPVTQAVANGGYTPLHLAAALGHESLCVLLSQNELGRSCIRLIDTTLSTPIAHAVRNGHSRIFRQLLDACGSDSGLLWSQKDKKGRNLLMMALQGKLPLPDVQFILQRSDLMDRDNDGNMALVHAVRSKDVEKVRLILSANDERGCHVLDAGRKPLTSALGVCRSEDVALALLGHPDIGVDPDVLFWVIERKYVRSAKMIAMRREIDLSAKFGGSTAEQVARKRGLDELADWLRDLQGV